jgi:hypothetical protein
MESVVPVWCGGLDTSFEAASEDGGSSPCELDENKIRINVSYLKQYSGSMTFC